MSKSSYKVGRMSGRGLIEHADQSYCSNNPHESGWDTADLGDFVQGILEAAVESLTELKPEAVREISEQEFEHQQRQMFLRRIQ